ncbi:MFS transporter [Mycoplasmatota bacterium]|nr:MFS transporter [Mycoplasmatota bacterium]
MNNKVITIILLMTMTVFINNFAHPVTPELVSNIGYNSVLLGTLFAAMALSNFLMSPVWGRLSDKYGRKPFMVMAPIGYGLAQLGFGYSTNPNSIIMFRLLAGGVTCASFVAGMAYLIDVSDINKRTKIMALYTAVIGFAGKFGNLLGGYIGDSDYHQAFLAQGELSILSSFVIFIFLKESHQQKQLVLKSNIMKDFYKYRNTIVPFLLIITVITSFFAIGFNSSFNSYMKFEMDLSPKEIGQIMALTGLIGIVMNIIILPIIKRKFNDYFLLILSLFFMFTTLPLAMFFESINFNLFIVMLILFFAFLALYRPLLQSILSKVGNANGEIMGLNNASNALGMMGGSFYAGVIFMLNVNLTFYSLSVIGMLTFGLLVSMRKKFEQFR